MSQRITLTSVLKTDSRRFRHPFVDHAKYSIVILVTLLPRVKVFVSVRNELPLPNCGVDQGPGGEPYHRAHRYGACQ